MKWRRLFFLFTCLLMQKLVSGQDRADPKISAQKKSNAIEFTCKNGEWDVVNGSKVLTIAYQVEASQEYICTDIQDTEVQHTITVKVRTCDNCVELDAPALSAIIVGNLLATFLIAYAVYNITGQPTGKNFSANKASDKVNLISNGDGDTYQQLNPGQTSEYSGLVGVRKK